MKKIKLSQNKYALIDNEDYDRINQWSWYYHTGYARRCIYPYGRGKTITLFLHRIVFNRKKWRGDEEVDHINGNTLDNRKKNLRICSRAENMMNQKNLHKKSYSGIRGIHWDKNYQKWSVHIKIGGIQKYFGSFETIQQARKVHKKEVVGLFGKFSRTT